MRKKIYDKSGKWVATETEDLLGNKVIKDRDEKVISYLNEDFIGNSVSRDKDGKVQAYQGQDALENRVLRDRDGKVTTYMARNAFGNSVFRDADGKTTGYYDLSGEGKGGFFSPEKPASHAGASSAASAPRIFDTGVNTQMPLHQEEYQVPLVRPSAPRNQSFGGGVKQTLSNSSFEINAHKLKGLKTVSLYGEDLKGYAALAASLLLQQKVPFDKTAEITKNVAEEERYGFLGLKKRTVYRKHVLETHNCWLMEQRNETDEDSRGNEREDTIYYVLTEKGEFLRGSERDYYFAGGGYKGNPLTWEHSNSCVSSKHIDLYLKSKNINMHSGMYKAMLETRETAQPNAAASATPVTHTPGQAAQKPALQQQFRRAVKMSPNDPCPCGSGKKYRDCHGKNVTIIEDKPKERMDTNKMAPRVLTLYEGAASWNQVKALRTAARNGDEEAQIAYGLCLLTGHNATASKEMGFSELRSAAEKGHPFAQYLIARCREENWFYRAGVDVNTVNWFLRAASRGYREAKLRAAYHISQGKIEAKAGTAESLIKQAGVEDKAETAARKKLEAYLAATVKKATPQSREQLLRFINGYDDAEIKKALDYLRICDNVNDVRIGKADMLTLKALADILKRNAGKH